MPRKTILFCFLFFVFSLLLSYGQSNEKIDLTLTNVTLKEFFTEIEKKTGYSFMYSNVDIDDNQVISINEKNGNIQSVLNKAFKNKAIIYELSARKILLKKVGNQPGQKNAKTIRGIVTDDKGEPIIGASVVVKGTTKGTITDVLGEYSLDIVVGETIVISYLGFLSDEFKVDDKTSFKIKLREDNQALSEVVVIGYGSLRKKDLTAAMTSVDVNDLKNRPTTNPAEALQGLVAGVNVQRTQGPAGSDVSVKIRGVNTFGSNEPLYIIDGFPGSISSVNPNDIEAMEILKDAAAAAIYGSVAANGVVIITTKNGKEGKVQVDINSFISSTSTAKRLKMLDADGYVKMHRNMYEEYNKYASKAVALPDYISNPGTYNTNWQDEIFRSGLALNQSVAVRGGQNDTKFALSANLMDEDGVVIDNSFIKQNARMKISTKKSIFTFDANMAFTSTKSSQPNFQLKEAYMISPLIPVYDKDQSEGFGLTNWGGIPNNVNVIADEHFKTSWEKSQNFAGNAFVGVDITKNLNFKTSYSYRGHNTQYHYHRPAFTADVKNPFEYPYYRERRTYWEEQIFDNFMTYNNKFDKHSVNVLLGISMTKEKSTWNDVAVEGKKIVYSVNNGVIQTTEQPAGFLDPNFMTLYAGRGGTYTGDGSKYEYNRMSYFGRLNYSYDDRYLLQFTMRRDGSSKFGKNNKYGNFPSLALGWRITEESFFPESDIVSNLKLRGSWGKLGNEVALGYYDSEALIVTSNSLAMGYVQGDGGNPWPGSIATGLENKTLRWETTVSKNIGLDYGFLNNKITGTINFYHNVTNDLLIRKRLAPSSGLATPILNVGKIRNSGIELEFNYGKTTGEFKYNLGFNISTLSNKVVDLADKDQILPGTGLKYGTEHFPNQTRIGYPIGALFLYKSAGIFQSMEEIEAHKNSKGELLQENAKPGDMRFEDVNGDGIIDDEDKVYSGTGMPKVEINLNLSASYKDFDVSALVGSGWGHKLYNGNRYFYEGMSSGSNFLESSLNAWTPENTKTGVPRAVLQDPNGNSRESDRFLESGNFIRLRQVQLGYTLPKNLLSVIRAENLRVYVSGENLLTWTKYNGVDPEFSAAILDTGVDRLIFPFTRSYVFGLQLTF